jgi:hypothetical protein
VRGACSVTKTGLRELLKSKGFCRPHIESTVASLVDGLTRKKAAPVTLQRIPQPKGELTL